MYITLIHYKIKVVRIVQLSEKYFVKIRLQKEGKI